MHPSLHANKRSILLETGGLEEEMVICTIFLVKMKSVKLTFSKQIGAFFNILIHVYVHKKSYYISSQSSINICSAIGSSICLYTNI